MTETIFHNNQNFEPVFKTLNSSPSQASSYSVNHAKSTSQPHSRITELQCSLLVMPFSSADGFRRIAATTSCKCAEMFLASSNQAPNLLFSHSRLEKHSDYTHLCVSTPPSPLQTHGRYYRSIFVPQVKPSEPHTIRAPHRAGPHMSSQEAGKCALCRDLMC